VAEYGEYLEQGVPLDRRPELVRSDERFLGDGEFVARVLEEANDRVRHQLPSERREHDVMKLVETVCKDVEISREELSSGSRRGPAVRARSLLAGRLVTELGIPTAEAARLLGVTTPAIAKALKRTVRE
jgi:hypothetical protein